MKTLEGKITFLVNREETTIQITDKNSLETFLTIRLTPEQLSSALSRLAMTKCTLEVDNLDRVGKKRITDVLTVEIQDKPYSLSTEEMVKMGKEACPKGWIFNPYLGSKDSIQYNDEITKVNFIIYKYEDE